MNFLRESLLTAWASFIVLISWVNAFDDTERAKTFDLNIGFDLTSNSDGVPSLKIRRFEEGSRTFRLEPKPSERADSFESDEKDKPDFKKRVQKPGTESNDDDTSSEYDGVRSTKGLRGDYEPEDIPKANPPSDDSDEDSD
ncbi:uncharacterized protein LOC106718723 isoform X1 [Papilio machaon]|uniref:uncharacterized protein LOC106718723 isoform X1 n=1 Tax=Papilio machaon TaxID=76193 RepID=UPI001E6632EA|nr:uncharacterized protein LOC106718723 isoform X1 [Papilio machaon]